MLPCPWFTAPYFTAPAKHTSCYQLTQPAGYFARTYERTACVTCGWVLSSPRGSLRERVRPGLWVKQLGRRTSCRCATSHTTSTSQYASQLEGFPANLPHGTSAVRARAVGLCVFKDHPSGSIKRVDLQAQTPTWARSHLRACAKGRYSFLLCNCIHSRGDLRRGFIAHNCIHFHHSAEKECTGAWL